MDSWRKDRKLRDWDLHGHGSNELENDDLDDDEEDDDDEDDDHDAVVFAASEYIKVNCICIITTCTKPMQKYPPPKDAGQLHKS